MHHEIRIIVPVREYVRLLRVRDWVKNLFILLPLFFSLRIGESGLLIKALGATAVYCHISSAVYIFNDLQDVEVDRLHPRKKSRPLAAGAITKRAAWMFMALLLVCGFGASVLLPAMIAWTLLYFLLNLAYSLKFKYIPIVDVVIIASGYVIRIFVGGDVTDTNISMWIIIMTFLLAMFIGLAKRRDDVRICLETGIAVREVVERYNLKFIDSALVVVAAVTIVAYIMYTVAPETVQKFKTDSLYLTAAFVVVGILRYLQLIFVEKKGGFPVEILFTDLFMQICLLGWIVTFGVLIYTRSI